MKRFRTRYKRPTRVSRFVYERAILKTLIDQGGECATAIVYRHVERDLAPHFKEHPDERKDYPSGEQIWKNQIRQAKRDLMRKDQLDGSERDNWKITELGRKRFAEYQRTDKDSDEPPRVREIDPAAME